MRKRTAKLLFDQIALQRLSDNNFLFLAVVRLPSEG